MYQRERVSLAHLSKPPALLIWTSDIRNSFLVISTLYMGCCPSRTDPAWATLRLQFSKCCCNMALYHGASHSGPQCSTQVPAGGSSPSPAPLWAPQLQPEAAPVGALHVLCLLQASSAAAPRASLWLQVEICKQYPWTTGGTACYSTALS